MLDDNDEVYISKPNHVYYYILSLINSNVNSDSCYSNIEMMTKSIITTSIVFFFKYSDNIIDYRNYDDKNDDNVMIMVTTLTVR